MATGDITIDEAVVRGLLCGLLEAVEAGPGDSRRGVLLHDHDPSGDAGDETDEDGMMIVVRENTFHLRSHPRQPGTGSAAMAELTAVLVVQCPAGKTAADERAIQRTINVLKLAFEDGETQAADGTLVQIDSWESEDAGAGNSQEGDHTIAYAAFRVSGTVTRCAGTDVTDTAPPEED